MDFKMYETATIILSPVMKAQKGSVFKTSEVKFCLHNTIFIREHSFMHGNNSRKNGYTICFYVNQDVKEQLEMIARN